MPPTLVPKKTILNLMTNTLLNERARNNKLMVLVIGKARMILRPIKPLTQQTKEPPRAPQHFHAQE